MLDNQEFALSIVYRMAYGLARDTIDAAGHDLAPGRRAIVQPTLLAELERRRGRGLSDEERGAAAEGIQDAEVGRRPRW